MANRLLLSGALAAVILLGYQIAHAGEPGKPCPLQQKMAQQQIEKRKMAQCKAEITRMGEKMMAQSKNMPPDEAAKASAKWAKMKQARMQQCQEEIQLMKKKQYEAYSSQKGDTRKN